MKGLRTSERETDENATLVCKPVKAKPETRKSGESLFLIARKLIYGFPLSNETGAIKQLDQIKQLSEMNIEHKHLL